MFGTDGIRGIVNRYPMTADVALRLGMASGIYFKHQSNGARTRVVIAKDTRLSGYLIEYALTSGLVSTGIDVILVGPMPTPAVPMLVKSLRADFGIMITASHNPYYDNGMKIFNQKGFKLSDKHELEIQNLIQFNDGLTNHLVTPENLGKVRRLDDAQGRYIEYIKSALPRNYTLSGLRIVLDCANGATYKIAPTVMWELGAEVISIHCEPNGLNINDNCGSMHPNTLANKVKETRADIGIAFDGDGDRVLVCDENGSIVDGDHLVAMLAIYIKNNKDNKDNNGIVITEASNGALSKFLEHNGFDVYVTKVGDRYISEEMRRTKSNIGGEQSGHIIIGDYNTTGDGLLASLHVLSSLLEQRKKASQLFNSFNLNPQCSVNINFNEINPLLNNDVIRSLDEIKAQYSDLRILVRKSGTENVIRVMVEGQSHKDIEEASQDIKNILRV